jgi:proteasome assembly chaperone (PAC2) family protein
MVVAFAGWPDAHEAATGAVKYLVRKLPARRFAELDPEEFYTFARLRPTVRLDADGERHLLWPTNDFYYWRVPSGDHDLVLFSGTEPHLRWRTYTRAIVEVAQQQGVQLVIALGSLLAAVPHTREPRVTGTANVAELRSLFEERRVRGSSYQGPASIATVLTDECARRQIQYATLWGHSPHYLQTASNARVTHALLQRLVPLLRLDVNLGEMAGACAAFETQLARLLVDNAEIRSYVQRLEEQYDQSTETQPAATEELPNSDVVIAELEDYLRRQNPGEGGPERP